MPHGKLTTAARSIRQCGWLAAMILLGSLSACTSMTPEPMIADAQVDAAWVIIGAGNQAIARANTKSADCPLINIDDKLTRMTLRAAAGTIPLRPTASNAADSKPSTFSTNTCEALLPPDVRHVAIGSRVLPAPKANPQRIVILGDTGCRMKKTDNLYQGCSDPVAWPFPTIAAAAARLKPDLVLHVGDYHYRETRCAAGIEGCQDSPWGYGSDTWDADLLQPGAPLLAAAPWIAVRGNHEECARAGQGWFRYLDPNPYEKKRSCDEQTNDDEANYTEPYAVSLGIDTQLIVFDSAKSGQTALPPVDPQYIKYRAQFESVGRFAAKPGVMSIFTSHHPVLGFVQYKGSAPSGFGAAFQSVLKSLYPGRYFPPEVQIAIHGHVHGFQAINFSSAHPATFVAGNGGDHADPSFPDPFPANASPAAGVTVESIIHSRKYGFMVMEREGSSWVYQAYDRDSVLMARCSMAASVAASAKIHCEKTAALAP